MSRALGAATAAGAALLLAGAAHTAPGVHVRTLRFVDRTRLAHYADGASGPRVLVTEVRYPAGRGPFPLVVFAHGFALVPGTYARLLDAWTRAGFVVAAPVFPVESANARGGPSQSDLPNEPRDLSFVLTRLLAARSPVRRLIDPHRIAFAGQSDGGIAALAASYDRRYRDRRVDAAMILSGAPLSGFSAPAPGAPPLLAVQGTADPFNAPATTASYFRSMRRPKFLLWLLGASHKPPYTTDRRYLGVVQRTTIAFLGRYLRGGPLQPLVSAGTRAGVARLVSAP